MKCEKPQSGVVILLNKNRLVLLTSDVCRRDAAHLMQHEKKWHRPLKFFAVSAARAAEAIQRINQSGLVFHLLDQKIITHGEAQCAVGMATHRRWIQTVYFHQSAQDSNTRLQFN